MQPHERPTARSARRVGGAVIAVAWSEVSSSKRAGSATNGAVSAGYSETTELVRKTMSSAERSAATAGAMSNRQSSSSATDAAKLVSAARSSTAASSPTHLIKATSNATRASAAVL